MATTRRAHASYLAAAFGALLAACTADDTDPDQSVGTGGTGSGGTSAAGTAGTGLAAGSGGKPGAMTGGPNGSGGTGTAGMGSGGKTGAAGMMTVGTGGSAAACNATSPDSDDDGTPDCMDMCPMDEAKIAPGMCGCDKPDTDAGTCMDMEPDDAIACAVSPIPDDVRSAYELTSFYTRYASADGVPIVATDKPEDEAITRACRVVLDLSSTYPKARESMRSDHIYFIMMAKSEKTVDTPEYRSRGDLDQRARGFGNNPGLCAEENVMCDRSTDRWQGESICVHEYSHVMHLYVWNSLDAMFDSKVNAAFDNAVQQMGKYNNTYAASNAVEYFAEGVQDWYNTNIQSSRGEAGDGVHNHINTREELKAYDPMLYDLLATVLPDVPKFKDCYYYE